MSRAIWVWGIICCAQILLTTRTNGGKTCPSELDKIPSDFSSSVIPACPHEYRGSCCTQKSLSTPSLECQYPWRIWNRQACLGGFYKKLNSSTKPCPPGFYCPESRTCVIPCQSGAYCPESKLVEFFDTVRIVKTPNPVCAMLDMCCLPYNQAPVKQRDWFVCGGTASATVCPPGYYCPNTTTKTECPAGHFCAKGSIKPRKCPVFTYCAAGQSSPRYSVFGIIIDLLLLVLGAVLFWLRRSSDKVKKFVSWKWIEDVKEDITENTGGLDSIPTIQQTFNIRFFNVSCTLKEKSKRKILSEVSGELPPSCMTAIVGPSGCGKTTLINVLCGKAYYGNIEGHVLINGKDVPISKYRNVIGFVPLEDTMHRELTVREVFLYQARLRLSPQLSKASINHRVNQVIKLLKLSAVADSLVGDQESGGICSGERKRVSIGMELLADIQILILDEPTSGLDSSSSLVITTILKSIADKGIMVCATVHQPRYEIFEMFDHLLLLSQGGQLVYQGSPQSAATFFTHIGFPPPQYVNPADFYIDVISGNVTHEDWDLDKLPVLWEEYNQQLTVNESTEGSDDQKWELQFSKDLDLRTHAVEDDGYDDTFKLEAASWREIDLYLSPLLSLPQKTPECFRQLLIFLGRSLRCQFRVWRSLLFDQFLVVLCALITGLLFPEVNIIEYMNFVSVSGLCVGLLTVISSLRCFGSQRTMYWRESSVGINRLSFFLAVNVTHLPQLVLTPLVYWSTCYNLASPRSAFHVYYSVFLAVVFAVSGLGYLASILFSQRNSQIASVAVVLISSMFSGSLRWLCDMDSFTLLGPFLYKTSFSKYMCQALFEKEVAEFPDVMRGYPDYVSAHNHYGLDEFSFCIGRIVLMGLVYRVLAYFALVFTNRGKQI